VCSSDLAVVVVAVERHIVELDWLCIAEQVVVLVVVVVVVVEQLTVADKRRIVVDHIAAELVELVGLVVVAVVEKQLLIVVDNFATVQLVVEQLELEQQLVELVVVRLVGLAPKLVFGPIFVVREQSMMHLMKMEHLIVQLILELMELEQSILLKLV